MKLYDQPYLESFPDEFLWGVALSAKQAEGSCDRALTVADIQNYDPNDQTKVKGDFTKAELLNRVEHPDAYYFPKQFGIDFYHTYQEDITLLKQLGIRCFRFSISWSRIYANGSEKAAVEAGLQFYESLLTILKQADIQPIVTLYHDDMPIDLALTYNGFLHPRVVELFVSYATLLMQRYQHLVTYWIPVNQINLTRVGLSSLGIIRDCVDDLETSKVLAVHHKFLACAKIKQVGQLIDPGFKFGAMLADFLVNPMTCAPEDIVFATEKNQMTMYYYADVQLRGSYPAYALRYFHDRKIPLAISEADRQLLQSYPMDFLAISYYNSNVVSSKQHSMDIGDAAMNPYLEANPWGWTINPSGLYDCFLKYWDRYGVPLMIAENGFGQIEDLNDQQSIQDDDRIQYMRDHVLAIKKAIQHGVNVFAYCAWSPIDMVSSGTSEMKKRYGMVYLDRNDDASGSLKRIPKASYFWYQNVIATNGESLSEATIQE